MTSILLVDDEPIVSKAVRGALQQSGFCVKAVDSVEKAMVAVHQSEFGAILLEFNIKSRRKPHSRTAAGLSLISRLRSSANRAPILMFTAMAGEPYERAALEAGAVAFIRKTDGVALLVACLHSVIGQNRSADRIRSASK